MSFVSIKMSSGGKIVFDKKLDDSDIHLFKKHLNKKSVSPFFKSEKQETEVQQSFFVVVALLVRWRAETWISGRKLTYAKG